MSKIIIIGAGPAGIMAAIRAASNGHIVHIYEKNEKIGKKLFITGKGRCNITNACDMDELFGSIVTNSKFLYSSFYTFNNYDVIDFFESIGLPIKIERGNRVFPSSDKSSDVIKVLTKELEKLGVHIHYNSEVTKVLSDQVKEGKWKFQGIKIKGDKGSKENTIIYADKLIIATGGMSYQLTGSTGDGYRFVEEYRHTITTLSPALVPFQTKEIYPKEIMGLALKNISVKVYSHNKVVYTDFGELLFTHFGISGPTILSASSYVVPFHKNKNVIVEIDLKPALSEEQLDSRILRDFEKNQNKQLQNSLNELLPKKLIPIIVKNSGIHSEKKINEITREERFKLVRCMKSLTLHVVSLRGYNEAIITRGGISVKEINPSTMESKIVEGMYFAGEIIDVDALTGGFNLQIAWSTGYVAGNAC